MCTSSTHDTRESIPLAHRNTSTYRKPRISGPSGSRGNPSALLLPAGEGGQSSCSFHRRRTLEEERQCRKGSSTSSRKGLKAPSREHQRHPLRIIDTPKLLNPSKIARRPNKSFSETFRREGKRHLLMGKRIRQCPRGHACFL